MLEGVDAYFIKYYFRKIRKSVGDLENESYEIQFYNS